MFKEMTLVAAMAFIAFPAFADTHNHDHGAADGRTPAPEGAAVYIISPQSGETVSNPVTIRFGASGIGIAPAGVDVPGTGHHHLLINVDPAQLDLDMALPADDQHRHFGGGQTEVTLDLPAGTHNLMLLMGDQFHVPHEPALMSEVVTITVE
jgi:hypothetical protein